MVVITSYSIHYTKLYELQQDAFDKIDCSTPLVRQEYLLKSVLDVADTSFEFKGFEDVSTFFKNVINQFKQLNYSEYESDQFNGYVKAIDELVQAQKK